MSETDPSRPVVRVTLGGVDLFELGAASGDALVPLGAGEHRTVTAALAEALAFLHGAAPGSGGVRMGFIPDGPVPGHRVAHPADRPARRPWWRRFLAHLAPLTEAR